jgi:hypothetical protein
VADGHAGPAADVDRAVTVAQPGEVDESLVRLAVLDRHHERGDHTEGALRTSELGEEGLESGMRGHKILRDD